MRNAERTEETVAYHDPLMAGWMMERRRTAQNRRDFIARNLGEDEAGKHTYQMKWGRERTWSLWQQRRKQLHYMYITSLAWIYVVPHLRYQNINPLLVWTWLEAYLRGRFLKITLNRMDPIISTADRELMHGVR